DIVREILLDEAVTGQFTTLRLSTDGSRLYAQRYASQQNGTSYVYRWDTATGELLHHWELGAADTAPAAFSEAVLARDNSATINTSVSNDFIASQIQVDPTALRLTDYAFSEAGDMMIIGGWVRDGYTIGHLWLWQGCMKKLGLN